MMIRVIASRLNISLKAKLRTNLMIILKLFFKIYDGLGPMQISNYDKDQSKHLKRLVDDLVVPLYNGTKITSVIRNYPSYPALCI